MSDDHVTARELDAHLGPIHEDIKEIKGTLREIADSQWLGPQGRTFLTGGAVLVSAVALFAALFH